MANRSRRSRTPKRSVKERVSYHTNRAFDSTVSDNKRFYSKQWVEGYEDPHAKFNYSGICHEIESCKRRKNKDATDRTYLVGLYGFKNGLKAQLDKK